LIPDFHGAGYTIKVSVMKGWVDNKKILGLVYKYSSQNVKKNFLTPLNSLFLKLE